MIYTLKTESMTFCIDDMGAELISATSADGFEFIWNADPKYWSKHGPLLFPICGRIDKNKYTYRGKEYDMKIHGFISHSRLNVENVKEHEITLTLTESANTLAIYPFPFKVTVTYTADRDSITMHSTVENTGNDTLPFMFGGHQGFTVPMDEGLSLSDYVVDLGVDTPKFHRERSEPFFNEDEYELYELEEDCLHLSDELIQRLKTALFEDAAKKIALFSPKGKRRVTMEYSDTFKYMAIWKAHNCGAKFICLEPWSGIPSKTSDFETRPSMIRLAPGEKENFKYTITFNG